MAPGPGTAIERTIIDIEPLSIRIRAQDEAVDLVRMLGRTMRAEPTSDHDIDVIIQTAGRPCPDDLPPGEGDPSSWRTFQVRDRVCIRASPSRRVFLCEVKGYPEEYPVAQTRWHLASFIVTGLLAILSDTILLVHAAMIARGVSAHILAGPSGSGKTTAASRVPPPWRGMADDMLAVVATRDGYRLLPLPTWSVFDDDPAAPHSVDTGAACALAGTWFIEPSPVDGIAPLSGTPAVRRLIGNSLGIYTHYWRAFGADDRLRIQGDILRHATNMIAQAPCGVLRVSLNGRFWDLLPVTDQTRAGADDRDRRRSTGSVRNP